MPVPSVLPLALNEWDVTVLGVIVCPLLQGVTQDFLGQAVCKLGDHNFGPWGFPGHLLDNWRRHPRRKSVAWHEAFCTFMPVVTLHCSRKWECLLWFHAAHVRKRLDWVEHSSECPRLLQHLWKTPNACPRGNWSVLFLSGPLQNSVLPVTTLHMKCLSVKRREVSFWRYRTQNTGRLGGM